MLDTFYEACLYDVCVTPAAAVAKPLACATITAFAQLSLDAGLTLPDWRPDSSCGKAFPAVTEPWGGIRGRKWSIDRKEIEGEGRSLVGIKGEMLSGRPGIDLGGKTCRLEGIKGEKLVDS